MHDIALIFRDFPRLFKTFAVFHDFPGLETGLPKFRDFPWLSRTSGHPASGRFPSERLRPDGSLETGTPAEARYLAMTSLRWWAIIINIIVIIISIISGAHADVDFSLRDEQHFDGGDEVVSEVWDVDVALAQHLIVVPHVHRIAETRAQFAHVLHDTITCTGWGPESQ